MKFGVIVFPGSNCDHDAYHAAKHVLGQECEFIWHKETDLKGADVLILPGGFAHGDYLRTGAIARFSPVIEPVSAFAAAGNPVMEMHQNGEATAERSIRTGPIPPEAPAFDMARATLESYAGRYAGQRGPITVATGTSVA